VAGPPALPGSLDDAALRGWRRRLLHGDWRLWDLEFFHALVAAITVGTALAASILVAAMTRTDGTVRVSVLFVACGTAGLVITRGVARAGLHSTERRTAATASLEARRVYLDAVARGATVMAGAAASFVTRSADDVGTYVAKAVPARVVAAWVPLGVLVVVALIDPWSALIAAGVLVFVPVVMIRLGRRATAEAQVGLGRLRSLSTRALELLEGAVELRALGVLARGRTELAAATDRAVESTRRSLVLGLRSATALDVLAGTAVGLVAMVDGFRLLGGTISLGHALAAVLLTVEVFAPLRAAGAAFHAGADGRAALGMLDAVDRQARDPAAAPRWELARVAAVPAAVSAQDAAIAPKRGGAPVIEGLTFAVPARGALVLTGPSGCGKTTVLRAVAGTAAVVRGTVHVGNSPPARHSARQRSALLAVVDQRPFLVAGSIRANLVLGSGQASEDAIAEVVATCGLAPLLARSPLGIDAQVGEEGRLLSAGERTCVALARAVLRDPGVLLLDEVGAHLDDAALSSLRSELAGFLSRRTVIEVAHERPLLHGAPRLDLRALQGAW
jgi:ABC-type transport system involved in cytochrome bd biosynthesis fused ATPase/permease subunit